MRDLDETERKRLLDGIRYLLYEHEPKTPEEIDTFLRSEGVDPDVIAAKGRAFAAKALEEVKKTLE